MRLAALKNMRGQKNNEIFELTEVLLTILIGILIIKTEKDELIWDYKINVCHAELNRFGFTFDQPNNEPAFLYITSGKVVKVVQDNGSGAYGFAELGTAIQNQKERREQKAKAD